MSQQQRTSFSERFREATQEDHGIPGPLRSPLVVAVLLPVVMAEEAFEDLSEKISGRLNKKPRP